MFFVDAGTITKCEMEGEEIFVPYISDDPCFSCRCQVNNQHRSVSSPIL